MEIRRHVSAIHLTEESQVGEARRAVVRMAEEVKLDEKRTNAAALVATELATNILKHAREGDILVQGVGDGARQGLQIIALDKGPGIRDMPAALSDGWSTTGTLGGGLGAIRRLADGFDIHSLGEMGTAVLSEFWANGQDPSSRHTMEIGTVSIPFPGEELNGDGWATKEKDDRTVLMVIDGLGHGPLAADAAREGERIFLESNIDSPAELLQISHDGLGKTRGAAMAIASLDSRGDVLKYAGTGNISGSISTTEVSRGLASHNGTVGHIMARVQEFDYPWNRDSLLIFHSDGISAKWNLEKYPGLHARRAVLIAAVIFRDFRRSRDDSTVLVARSRAA